MQYTSSQLKWITASDYENQPAVITGEILWDDPDVKKWGWSPICVVDFGYNKTPASYSIGSKPYRNVIFTF